MVTKVMSSKGMGILAERAWLNHLKAVGYIGSRSAASLSPVDVWAINKEGIVRAFQIKRAKYHKYVSTRLSEARKETKGYPIEIKIYCVEHRKWYEF